MLNSEGFAKNLHRISTADGHLIGVRRWPLPTTQTAKAVIHILHGMAEHSARYHDLAQQLNHAGFIVVAHDHRGHGASITDTETQGHFADDHGWKKVIDDVKEVHDWVHAIHPDKPIALLGHSMGSFIAQSYAIAYPNLLAGMILCGSSLIPMTLLRSLYWLSRIEAVRIGPRSANRAVHYLTFEQYNRHFKPNRTSCDWLSRDTQQVDAYVADPHCGFICTNQLWIDLAEELLQLYRFSVHARLPKNIPYYLIAGSQDPVGNFSKQFSSLGRRLKKIGIKNLTTHLYPDARHELFNETCRDQVIGHLIQWLDTHL